MSFDYNKIKGKQEENNQWASYSDLFMVLSIVFLLLYVVASVRSGTFSLQKQIQMQEMEEQNADLKNQIQAYNALKEGYLEQEATKREQKVYKALMDKLTLLKEEQKEEKDDLRQKAAENEKKEMALNKYQQLIRNIVNTNMIAKSRIKRRDKIIVKKQEVISEKQKIIETKKKEIKKLETTVSQKKRVIAKNKKQISSINSNLDKQIKRLRASRKKLKLTKRQLSGKIRNLQKTSKRKILSLKKKNTTISKQLSSTTSRLVAEKRAIKEKTQKISELSVQMSQAQSKLSKTKTELVQAKKQNREQEQQLEELQTTYKSQLKRKQQLFQARLKVEKLSALEKSKRIAAFQQKIAREKIDHLKQVKSLNSLISNTKTELVETKSKNKRYVASISNLKSEKKTLSKDLKSAKAIIDAKKKIAAAIRTNFKKAGIDAKIDGKSGDVTLSFGKNYFDTGRAKLKNNMRKTLNKFVPIYAKSLFNDVKIAKKIESVEIVGFASPTYGGKYISPTSLRPEDREAIQYNLNLSIDRAKSIFNHMFDTSKLKYHHQQVLRKKVKVTGRGYFTAKDAPKHIKSGMPRQDFCNKYDCQKAQKVIIKFNLED